MEPEHLSEELSQIESLSGPMPPGRRGEGWIAAFSCNGQGQVFPIDNRDADLRGKSDLLDDVVDAVLAKRKQGGRIYISKSGAYTWDSEQEGLSEVVAFPSQETQERSDRDTGRDRTVETVNSPHNPDPVRDSLYGLLRSCQLGQAGVVVGGHIDRNPLRQELYVPTKEDELLRSFFVDDYEEDGKLMILTGSAGDGKTALLSRAFVSARDEGISSLTEDCIHLDATEATNKHGTYTEDLTTFLDRAQKDLETESGPRKGLAINLGLAIDFFERQERHEDYPRIWKALDAIREGRTPGDKDVVVIDLGNRETFDRDPEDLGRGLLSEILEKFNATDPDSPLHKVYREEMETCPAGEDCLLRYNVEQLADEKVRRNLGRILAGSSLIQGSYLNPRAILDLITSILLPPDLREIAVEGSGCPVGRALEDGAHPKPSAVFWNSVFKQVTPRGPKNRGFLDPASVPSRDEDLNILSWTPNPAPIRQKLGKLAARKGFETSDLIRTYLRKQYLIGEHDADIAIDWSWFKEFAGALKYLNLDREIAEEKQDLGEKAGDVTETVRGALRGWAGSTDGGDFVEFVDGIQSRDHRMLSRWGNPRVEMDESRRLTRRESRPGQIWVVLRRQNPTMTDSPVKVPLTFELYVLMKRIQRGYNPNAVDVERSEGLRLIQSRISEFTDKNELVKILDRQGDERYRIRRDDIGNLHIREGG